MSELRRGRAGKDIGQKKREELFRKDNYFAKPQEKQNPEKAGEKRQRKANGRIQKKFQKEVSQIEPGAGFPLENQFQEAEKFLPDKENDRRKVPVRKNAGTGKETRAKVDKEKKVNDEKQEEAQDKENWLAGGDDTFTEDGGNAFSGSRKLERKQKKAERADGRLKRAKSRLPVKKEYSLERVFDEETGKGKYVLRVVEKEKDIRKKSFRKNSVWKLGRGRLDFSCGQEKEEENGNAGIEAAFTIGRQAESAFGFVAGRRKGRGWRQRQKVSALEDKKTGADVAFRYQKYLEENPEMKKKLIRKRIQKQRIKREYVKAYRKKLAEESAGKTISLTKDTAIGAVRKLGEAVKSRLVIVGIAGMVSLLLILVLTLFVSCGAVAGEAFSLVIAGSYLSQPEEIDKAELHFTEREMELQEEIDAVEEAYPDFDEYHYNLGEIGHNPFTLISYLSAVYIEFTAGEVMGELEELFQEMYTLSFQPVTEIRRVQAEDGAGNPVLDGDGNPVMEDVEVKILQVTLEVISLEEITAGRMDGEQAEIFAAYTETKGGLQQFDTPLDLYWYSYVSSYYGYRKNPFSGQRQLHRGIDIAVPENTPVYAAHAGIVETAAFDSEYGNYVVIRDEKGFVTKYAHLNGVNVTAEQEMESGSRIGLTGNTGSSTGSHLHLEVLHNGIYYNPLFYFDVGDGTLYGEDIGEGDGAIPVVPPESYDEDSVRMLLHEAEKYLGTPYLFGGYGPGGFDCSGFVSWVFSNSGVHDLPRTTAQGIYEQCVPVSVSEAKAGDIVFFTGTYQAGRPVTHVGIYCGNGIMIHAGDPVQYTSFATSAYWQSHFYGFGRI